MIDKAQLRIGNWVNCHFQTKNFNAQVLEIRHGGVLVQEGEHRNAYGYDNVSPIALSEEILEKSGFELRQESEEWANYFTARNYWVAVCKQSNVLGYEGEFVANPDRRVTHLHQLQNIYYALVSEELKTIL